jgi:adsorption protein A
MKRVLLLLAVLIASTTSVSAQEADLAGDLTGYRRFIVYPHLQKGWESTRRGERDRALTELERAHALAPESAGVTLHLAAAYRKFGEVARAESVLREQLAHTPDDARVRSALSELRTLAAPAAPAAVASPCTGAACGQTPTAQTSRDSEPVTTPREPKAGTVARSAPVVAARKVSGPVTRTKPAVADRTDRAPELRTGFTAALAARRFDDALQLADSMVSGNAKSTALIDELSYKLTDAGASEQAVRFLLQVYPFTGGTPAERDTLFQRLAILIAQHAVASDPQLVPLRTALDTPALRSRQAAMWTDLKECETVRAILSDMSADYGHDDWMRLGDCSKGAAPEAARQAYSRAHVLQPGGRGSRELAYEAYAAGDYRTALDAWRSVGPEHLQGDALLSAVTTALAAHENHIAANWLQTYRERGDTLDRRYWSLLGQSYGEADATAAIAAFERAVALSPALDDYLRLARLERTADRQVQWLERAAHLDRENAALQLQLAYAYSRAGRAGSALSALERAAALDPTNMHVQTELGYAHWRAGHGALALRALERALQADPGNVTLAQQLVYISQRLKQNDSARSYAEQVLDSPLAFTDSSGGGESISAADRRFAMQRLHEDLGRRVTISLDGFSGTHVGTPTSAPQAGNRYTSYSQIEADVRLGSPAIRDGSTVSAYVRVLADGGDARSALPSRNSMLGLGLRWKPWRSQVIYLAAENQTGLEDRSRKDVLLRASASFFNGGRYGDDWHASNAGWISTNLYVDAAHYVDAEYSAFTADYRTSYHRRVASKQTLEPYGHLQFNAARSPIVNDDINRDVRAGVGLRWNLWHGATTYDADPHKLSLGVEVQQAFDTYLPDRNGVFVTLGTRW